VAGRPPVQEDGKELCRPDLINSLLQDDVRRRHFS
jgi:hypothetical protein